MIRSGLTSVTFRKLSPQEIIDLAVKARLDGIEWGGDIHVPHGNLRVAREVAAMTRDAGLEISSYGSYYVLCSDSSPSFESVVETAAELKTGIIRVWAGEKSSEDADEAYWDSFVAESRRIGDMAAQAGISIAFEFHGNSLTDSNESALRLLKTVDHTSIKTYWQPPVGKDKAYSLDGLRSILPWLLNVHVYNLAADHTRLPLEQGMDDWRLYMKTVRESGRDHFALLEFVRNDDPQAFIEDAAALRDLL